MSLLDIDVVEGDVVTMETDSVADPTVSVSDADSTSTSTTATSAGTGLYHCHSTAQLSLINVFLCHLLNVQLYMLNIFLFLQSAKWVFVTY